MYKTLICNKTKQINFKKTKQKITGMGTGTIKLNWTTKEHEKERESFTQANKLSLFQHKSHAIQSN